MSVNIDSEDELRHRMSDLQQKLRDSEEERKKLEKTCDMLLRAFREEEKRHYKALNIKYEKFLEDYSIRRKRNDLILRMLCRVEDRAKVLFAKTERLKLLKDRYISYLKQNEFFQTEKLSSREKICSPGESNSKEVKFKTVRWKTPNVADIQEFSSTVNDGVPEAKAIDLEPEFLRRERYENEFCASSDIETRHDVEKFHTENYVMQPENNVHSYMTNENHPILESHNLSHNNNLTYKNDEIFNLAPVFSGDKKLIENSSISQQLSNIIRDPSPFKKFEKNSQNDNGSPIKSYKTAQNSSIENPASHYPKLHGIYIQNDNIEFFTTIQNSKDRAIINNFKPDEHSKSKSLDHMKILRERGVLKHQESIDKLKVALEVHDGKEKNEKKEFTDLNNLELHSMQESNKTDKAETNEKQNISCKNGGDSSNTYSFNLNCKKKNNFNADENLKFIPEMEIGKNDRREDLIKATDDTIYPKGLDGIDYQNETYPESYYEQPVHTHNYSNISSNVILEEDEYELDADQQDSLISAIENISDENQLKTQNISKYSIDVTNFNELRNPSTSSLNSKFDVELHQTYELQGNIENDINGHELSKIETNKNSTLIKNFKETEIIDLDTDNGFIGQDNNLPNNKYSLDGSELKSGKDKEFESNSGSEQLKLSSSTPKSNLIHLLESDSESFQIEHGEMVSENDDSDFDFSFK